MDKLNKDISTFFQQSSNLDYQEFLKMRRALEVRSMWEALVEPVFVEHTNNVYLLHEEELWVLIVYVDESIFSAELNARRELIKYKFKKEFNQQIDEFKIFVSREKYRSNHPFASKTKEEKIERKPLSEDELRFIDETTQSIENKTLRNKMKEAMIANLQLKNAENEANDPRD